MKSSTRNAYRQTLAPTKFQRSHYEVMDETALRERIKELLVQVNAPLTNLVTAWSVYRDNFRSEAKLMLEENDILALADKVANKKLHPDVAVKFVSNKAAQRVLAGVPVEKQVEFIKQPIPVVETSDLNHSTTTPFELLTNHQVNLVYPTGSTTPRPPKEQQKILVQKAARRETKVEARARNQVDDVLAKFVQCGKWGQVLTGTMKKTPVTSDFSKKEAALIEAVAKQKGQSSSELIRRIVLSVLADCEE